MNAPRLRPGSSVRVLHGNLEGCVGTILDDGGGLPELPGQAPPKWWVDPANLERVP